MTNIEVREEVNPFFKYRYAARESKNKRKDNNIKYYFFHDKSSFNACC